MDRKFHYDNVINFLGIMEEQKKLMEDQKNVTDAAYGAESDDEIRGYLTSITTIFGKGIEETALDYAGFQGVHNSIMEQDGASGKELDDNYTEWKTLDSKVKQLNGTLKTGISFGSAGYSEKNREFNVDQFLAEMEKAKITNQEMSESLIQDKYAEYNKAEKWKEVMKEEDLTRIELMALGRVGSGLGEEAFSGAGGFMELAEVRGFDWVAEADPELYTRMFRNLMAFDWRDIYSKEKLSGLEIAVMAQNVLNFEKNEDWDDFATMLLKTDLIGNYYLDQILEEIRESALLQFGAAQYAVIQISSNLNEKDENALLQLDNSIKKWSGNLALINLLTSDTFGQDFLGENCFNNGENVGGNEDQIFQFTNDGSKLSLKFLSHVKKEYADKPPEEDKNCVEFWFGTRLMSIKGMHPVCDTSLNVGDVNTFEMAFSMQTLLAAGHIDNANKINSGFAANTALSLFMSFQPPEVGVPYSLLSSASSLTSMADNRNYAGKIINLEYTKKLGKYFPNSIQTAYYGETDAMPVVFYNNKISTDLNNLQNIINNKKNGVSKLTEFEIKNSSNYAAAAQYLKQGNHYVYVLDDKIYINKDVLERIKIDLSFSPDRVVEFLNVLELLK